MNRIRCANPDCQATLVLKSEPKNPTVNCPKCGSQIRVKPASVDEVRSAAPSTPHTCYFCRKDCPVDCIQLTLRESPEANEKRTLRVWRCENCGNFHNRNWWFISVPVGIAVFVLLFVLAGTQTMPNFQPEHLTIGSGTPIEFRISKELLFALTVWLIAISLAVGAARGAAALVRSSAQKRNHVLPFDAYLQHPRLAALVREFPAMTMESEVVDAAQVSCPKCLRSGPFHVVNHGKRAKCPHCQAVMAVCIDEEIITSQ